MGLASSTTCKPQPTGPPSVEHERAVRVQERFAKVVPQERAGADWSFAHLTEFDARSKEPRSGSLLHLR